MNTAMIGGAAVAGFLVAGVGPGWAIAVDAGTYLLAAGCVALMRLPAVVREQAANFLHELAVGWREFRSRTWLWAIVLQFSFMLMVVLGAFSVLGPVVADEELGGATAWGLILTGWTAGLVTGGLVGLRFRPRGCCSPPRSRSSRCRCPLVALGFPLGVPAIAATAFVAGHRERDLRAALAHDDAAGDPDRQALARLLLRRARLARPRPARLCARRPAADAFGVRATLWGAAAIAIRGHACGARSSRRPQAGTPRPAEA